MHSESPHADAASRSVAARDRDFLVALGIQPYDPGGVELPAADEQADSRDPAARLINALAVIQFVSLLATLIWMWCHLP